MKKLLLIILLLIIVIACTDNESDKKIVELESNIEELQEEIAELRSSLKENKLQVIESNEKIKEQINVERNCDLAKKVTKVRVRNNGTLNLQELRLDFEDIKNAINENDFWFFPERKNEWGSMTEKFVSEKNYIESAVDRYGSLFMSQFGDVLLTGDNVKEIINNNCN
tara:strand:- start:117 stop:620 length:504 start_codon:yes stop_codon:yes gene_type:complete